ncbi:MAG: NADH:ubiquinone reductase (Na(+)-transporting) subunit C, partial [Paludibacteraceae bacterium]|nr:NADH:ubiquinone reductase (Na(+)-transporting) subunit C [Paludibacteraceae bacterium]
MNTNSNVYTIVYASIMVIVVAFVLAFFSGSLKEKQDLNVNLDKKKQILYALNLDLTNQDLASVYSKYITQELIVNVDGEVVERTGGFEIDLKTELSKENPADRKLPVYECNVDGETKYIFPLYGAGLWGPIWGYIALNHDKNTVYGVYFSHAGETPGLGAEITSHVFQSQFPNKKIKNTTNDLVSIAIVKPGKTAEGQ